MPSGLEAGQEMARMVERDKASVAAYIRKGAGRDEKKKFSPVRAEKRVRKSLTDTLCVCVCVCVC